MDGRLLSAALTGDARSMKQLVLLGTTPQGNTCLHIALASIHGHESFCKDSLALNCSVLSSVNADEETPLLTAVKRGHVSSVLIVLSHCRDQQLSEAILKQDHGGCNVLHHALRGGHREIALELIAAEPALSRAVDRNKESPMLIAVTRNDVEVFEKLLEIPDSAHSGAFGYNALHAAVRNGNSEIAKRLMETRPCLVREETSYKYTPMHLAAIEDKIELLTVLLEHDPSLGYVISTTGVPILCAAAWKGRVGVARELLKHCPNAPYRNAEDGFTCLHRAVESDQTEFIEFILESPQLRHLIGMLNGNGDTAQHLAIKSGMPQPMIDALQPPEGFSVKQGTASTTTSAMDWRLVEAATYGDTKKMQQLSMHDRAVMLSTTQQGNTCLHIAAIHGHEGFCKDALALNPSLLIAINSDGETPLLTAVTSGRVSLAYILLRYFRDQRLREAILKQDKNGFNTLHHAYRKLLTNTTNHPCSWR